MLSMRSPASNSPSSATCRIASDRFALFFVLLLSVGTPAESRAQPNGPARVTALDSDTIKSTVFETADIINREYMDAGQAARLADALRRHFNAGEYAGLVEPAALATRLTRDLFAESQDKHLAVTVSRQAAPTPNAPATATRSTREDDVRRSNASVRMVQVLPGNVGYLNLTSFWRPEEATEAIDEAMRLLRRADALIIDMRENGGGAPGTVAVLAGHLFDQPNLLLFDIVPRTGETVAYTTPASLPMDHDGQRPLYVLTSTRTFSAGEGFAFLMQERKRAQIVGDRTPGAANPGRSYPVNALFAVTVPNGRVRSGIAHSNWEGEGVVPDVEAAAADALRIAHGLAVTRLIETASGDWRTQLEAVRRTLDAPAAQR